jgi:alkylation response protein AidB-like acyl-CoA dehydrogenase
MERSGNPALRHFREAGGPGLLIPLLFGGQGATPLDAVRVHRALGGLAPSLSIAATMHNFSVASLVELARDPEGMSAQLTPQIAQGNLYVASGVAEGRPGASALSSALNVRTSPEGLILNGSKKPCSLSQSMSLLTASLQMPDGAPHAGEFAFAVIPADTPGIERRPFWKCPALAGAESEEVVLNNVIVPFEQLCFPDPEGRLLATGLLWFELLIAASYLGIADGLVVEVFAGKKGTSVDRAQLGIEQEAGMAALESIARAMSEPDASPELLPRALAVRYAVQATIESVTTLAAELLGGLTFISNEETALRVAAARMLAFHPPSRFANAEAMDYFYQGGPFCIA